MRGTHLKSDREPRKIQNERKQSEERNEKGIRESVV